MLRQPVTCGNTHSGRLRPPPAIYFPAQRASGHRAAAEVPSLGCGVALVGSAAPIWAKYVRVVFFLLNGGGGGGVTLT